MTFSVSVTDVCARLAQEDAVAEVSVDGVLDATDVRKLMAAINGATGTKELYLDVGRTVRMEEAMADVRAEQWDWR